MSRIDEKALRAAINEYTGRNIGGMSSVREWMKKAIEAYESAKPDTSAVATLTEEEFSAIINESYKYDKASGSRFVDIAALYKDIRPYLRSPNHASDKDGSPKQNADDLGQPRDTSPRGVAAEELISLQRKRIESLEQAIGLAKDDYYDKLQDGDLWQRPLMENLMAVLAKGGYTPMDKDTQICLVKAALRSLPTQPRDTSALDEFCITRDFEEWASLDPILPVDKDGDGEYENGATRAYYGCFEHAYKKGMWGASRHINGKLCDDTALLDAALANAAEILANFKSTEAATDKTVARKLEEWQACYAKCFTQLNEVVQVLHKKNALLDEMAGALERQRLHAGNLRNLLERKFQASDFVRCSSAVDAVQYNMASEVCAEVMAYLSRLHDWAKRAESDAKAALAKHKATKE